MRNIFHELAEYARNYPLREKLLIAPSLRVGNQWCSSAAKLCPIVNLRVMTLSSLALQLCGPRLAERRLKLMGKDQQSLLMLEAFCGLKEQGKLEYLHDVSPSLELGRLLSADWARLAEAGKSFAGASPRDFRSTAKLHDLQLIEAQFEQLVAGRNAVSLSDVFGLATAEYQANSKLLDSETLILLPDNLPLNLAQQKLTAALKDRVEIIGKQGYQADQTPAAARTRIQVFGGVGEANEIRNVLRICAENELSLDEVEVCCTDPDMYGSLLFEEVVARLGQDLGSADELPVTFSQGLPSSYSRPGRALASFVAWIREDFPQEALVRMLKEGLLELPRCDGGLQLSMSRLSQRLASLPIGKGRERYARQIELALIDCQMAGQRLSSESEMDDPLLKDRETAAIRLRQQELEMLQAIVFALLGLAKPGLERDSLGMAVAAQEFLQHYARGVNKFDRFALNKLLDHVNAMASWLEAASSTMTLDLREWLWDLPHSTRVMGSGPRAGCLHVSGIVDGGASGRPNLFLVGLDDRRFPPGIRQSPLFLDEESARVAPDMQTGESAREEAIRKFYALLSSTDVRVWCSFSALDLIGNKPQFPSYVLLDLYRAIRNDTRVGQEQFLREISPLASFAPEREKQALNRADWWLWRLSTPEQLVNAGELILSEYPNLKEGEKALRNRDSDQFTPHDGIVPEAGSDLYPMRDGVVSSASRLETAGTCPRKFLFKYGLELEQPDQFEGDPDRWLDALQFGSFLHKVLELYVSELVSRNAAVDLNENGERLREILRDRLDRELQINPPPNEEAFSRQQAELAYAMEQFLRMETRLCRERNCRPIQVEAHLGIEAPAENTGPLNVARPIGIRCGDGRILVRGKIDRIDLCSAGDPPSLFIWDYKSGGAHSYLQGKPFNQGRRLQPFLYCEMVRHQISSTEGSQRCVAGFGYVFPTRQGGGRRIEWQADELESGREALELISNLISDGRFHATDDPNDCRNCDYRRICGDPKRVTSQVLHKLEALQTAPTDFQKLRELK